MYPENWNFNLEKLKALLTSRKFWALVTALVTTVGAYMTAQIDIWQMIQAIVAALAAFSLGTAIEDAGRWVGSGLKKEG